MKGERWRKEREVATASKPSLRADDWFMGLLGLSTVNLRYSDSGYSGNLGYNDRFVRIKLVKLV